MVDRIEVGNILLQLLKRTISYFGRGLRARQATSPRGVDGYHWCLDGLFRSRRIVLVCLVKKGGIGVTWVSYRDCQAVSQIVPVFSFISKIDKDSEAVLTTAVM